MSMARRAEVWITMNGVNVSEDIAPFLESFSYTDTATGESDTISLTLMNRDMRWLDDWYPVFGDLVNATLLFRWWDDTVENFKYHIDDTGAHPMLECGQFVVDTIRMTGGPLTTHLDALSIPANTTFKTAKRTQTWEGVSISQIQADIASRYGMQAHFDAEDVWIESIEQNDKSDSSFMYDIAKTYDLGMKVFSNVLVLYSIASHEARNPVMTLSRSDFENDGWTFNDSINETYNGAVIKFKKGEEKEEIECYVGLVPQDDPEARTLKVTEQADSEGDARRKAAAKVNEANKKGITLSGNIFPHPSLTAGVCVEIVDLGKANGKYFVDQVRTSISGNGATSQSVEMHKVMPRITP